MLEAAVRAYRRINPRPVPERSVPLRVAVMAAVLAGSASVLAQGYFGNAFGFLVVAGIVSGNVVSWVRMGKDNWGLKLALSLVLPLVLAYYLFEVVSTPFDARVPLARLFLLVQVMHSFDVPARKDLYFSVVSAYTLLAVGGLLSVDSSFGLYIALFALCSAAALYYAHLSELGISPGRALSGRGTVRALAGTAAAALVATAVLAGAVFVALPRLPGMQIQGLPFSLPRPVLGGFSGQLVNRDYPSWMAGPGQYRYVPTSYYGFAPFLDLRLRGRLSENLVMKVRSSEPLLYRGLVFDRYTGSGWTMSDTTGSRLAVMQQPLFVPDEPEGGSVAGVRPVVQSYFIAADQPNVLFAAMAPRRLYFPGSSVWVDRYSSLRSPFLLTRGMVYTVVSDVAAPAESDLLSAPATIPAAVAQNYLVLPPLPERVTELSGRLTAGQPTEFQKVLAIQRFLDNNYRYDLSIPPQRGTGDPVDHFLFVERRGYCEQFASSFVVLCRASGIPARLVTGFGTGEFNPFTGLYEVRQSDAHAWAEVYYPLYGWVTNEPTPGFEVPRGPSGPWIGGRLTGFFAKLVGVRAPGLARWGKGAVAAFTMAAAGAGLWVRAVLESGSAPLAAGLVALAAAAVVGVAGGLLLARSRGCAQTWPSGDSASASAAFTELTGLFDSLGHGRRLSQTAREYARLLEGRFGWPEIGRVARLFEVERYGHRRLGPEEIAELSDAVRRLREFARGTIVRGAVARGR